MTVNNEKKRPTFEEIHSAIMQLGFADYVHIIREPLIPETQLMTLEEMEDLIDHLIAQTGWNHYTVDGLTFLLHTFAELANQDALRVTDDAHNLIRFVYKHSSHCSDAECRFKDAMHLRFRKTDYTQHIPLDIEFENPKEETEIEKETVLDLSEHTTKEGECLDLAKNLLNVLNDERLPKELVDAIHDQLTALDNKNDVLSEIANSAEYIAKILCAEKEVGQ